MICKIKDDLNYWGQLNINFAGEAMRNKFLEQDLLPSYVDHNHIIGHLDLKGLGRHLMKEVIAWIDLYTFEHKKSSIALYQNFGF